MDVVIRLAGPGLAETPVSVTIDGAVTGHQLVAALGDRVGVRHPPQTWWWERLGRRVVDDADVVAAEPRDGDRIIVGTDAPPGGAQAAVGPAATIEVLAGPDEGRTFDIPMGATVLGRGRGEGLRLRDDSVSRNHCRFTATGSSLMVEDLGSTNGTKLGGTRIGVPTPIADGAELRVGETRLRVRVPERAPSAPEADAKWSDGVLLLNRAPRVIVPEPSEQFDLPQTPDVAAKRQFPWIMVLLPLVPGGIMVGVAMTSGSDKMVIGGAAMMLMSPLMMLGNYFTEHKQGGRNAADVRADFERRFSDVSKRIDAASTAARRFRAEAAPATADLVAWCASASSRIWERRPRDPDFLTLRVGLADRPSLLEIKVPEATRTSDPECADRNDALAAAHRTDPAVPVVVPLDDVGVLGVHGSFDATAAVMRALVLQVATLHSPADVAVAAVVPSGAEDDWRWLSWLPHSQVLAARGARAVVVTDAADAILEAVEAIIAARESALEQRASVAVRSPRVLLVLPESDLLPAARLARLLERGPTVGVLAIAAAGSPAALPGECGAVLGVGARGAELAFTRSGHTIGGIAPEVASTDAVERAVVALAPLRDPNAGAGAVVPSSATCADIAMFDMNDPKAIRARWEMPDPSLSAPIGLTAGGVSSVSLRRDGPHGVVAGTTGAGKSEFLQTLIVSLAAHNSPQRLALVLVDLKGGAAFSDLARLPHTVGFFTDLDEHLAARALTSLNAELRRREEVLRAAGVKDLVDMEATGRPDTPPSLLIVFDEFAVLKTEMPDFIEGIVDIARRGRSLGVHMILATQSPTGVVDNHIRANTNLRVALRTANAQESQEIIERRDAADIPRDVHGRAWVRIGQDEPVLVQTAYSGRRSGGSSGSEARVVVREFGLGGATGRVAETAGESGGPNDANRIIDAAIDAAATAQLEPGPPPWLPPLPELVLEEHLHARDGTSGGLPVMVGVLDDPARQAQDPHVVDLAGDGNLAIFGASSSGKTTALRTIVGSLARRHTPAGVRFVVLDFASRALRGLSALPHTLAYVTPDDAALLDRVLARIETEISERRERVALAGAASMAEARAAGTLDDPFLVVVVDGLAAFVAEYQDLDLGVVLDQFTRIATDGRSAGVFVIVTVDRRAGLPMALGSAISERLVLRMVEDDDYIWLGVPEARNVEFNAGRAVLSGGRELQVAVIGGPSAAEQQAAIDELARSSDPAERIAPTPGPIGVGTDVTHPLVPLGVDALTDVPVLLDLEVDPWFLIAGADRSGRSTALGTIVSGWRRVHPSGAAFLIASRRTPLTAMEWTEVATDPDGVPGVVERVLERAQRGEQVLLAVDDGDQLGESGYGSPLDDLLRRARDLTVVVVATTTSHGVLRAFSGWLRDIRNPKMGLLLDPDAERDGEVFGGRIPRRARREFPVGRGYLVRGGDYQYVQVGTHGGT